MVSLYEIKKAIFLKMKIAFPEYKLYGEKVDQGLVTPSFHIDIIPFSSSTFTKNSYDLHYFVNMTHFPVNGKREDDLIAYDIWRETFFGAIQLENGDYITPKEQRCMVVDGLMHMIFNIEERVFVEEIENVENISYVTLKI